MQENHWLTHLESEIIACNTSMTRARRMPSILRVAQIRADSEQTQSVDRFDEVRMQRAILSSRQLVSQVMSFEFDQAEAVQ